LLDTLHATRGIGRVPLASGRAEGEERKAGKGESEKGKNERERYEYNWEVMKKIRKRAQGVRFAACDGHESWTVGLEARASVAGMDD
jgi:hypothetical protein